MTVSAVTEVEILELIDQMALTRYHVDGIEFLSYVTEDPEFAEQTFPGCHDMIVLAQALDP